jgi:hypothetical protein
MFAALCITAVVLAGCYGAKRLKGVEPVWSQVTCELTADQVVALMREAGFTDDEILKLGTDVRNALASEGGAKIMTTKYTRAMFVVYEVYIYVVVREGKDVVFPLPADPAADQTVSPAEEPGS